MIALDLPSPVVAPKPRNYRTPQVRVLTVQETKTTRPIVDAALKAATFWTEVVEKSDWYDPDKESFVVLHLDRKNRLKGWEMITIGTATAALAHPREVFRGAIVSAAAAIICMHNHPSGDPQPSAPDMHVTRMLREASKTVDIDLIDHVIRGEAAHDPMGRGYFSFREAGML